MKAMKMSEGGRVVVPAEIRKALNVRDGDTVYWELVDGEARLSTKLSRLRRSQQVVQRVAPNRPGMSVVEELLAERKREAELD
ncbi:MAG: AbrB/MazE/SpoVT family DNA-binding domain-containing protein [Vulcanimicrobiota bacterium]